MIFSERTISHDFCLYENPNTALNLQQVGPFSRYSSLKWSAVWNCGICAKAEPPNQTVCCFERLLVTFTLIGLGCEFYNKILTLIELSIYLLSLKSTFCWIVFSSLFSKFLNITLPPDKTMFE